MASVSIVLLTRERPEVLAQALDSVAKQTHLEVELVLVRDGGQPLSDAAVERIEALEFPTQRIEHDGPAEGIALSRNRGVEAARADAVAFLDDDDLWEPRHVGRLAAALDRDTKLDVIYTDAWILHAESGQRRTLARDFDFKVFGRDGFIPPSAMLARRDAFGRFGLFDPQLTYSEDWDWLLRVARGQGIIERLPGASVTVRIHAGGASSLHPDRLPERRRCLEILAKRHRLSPIQPKTFWEVAEALCPDGNVSTP